MIGKSKLITIKLDEQVVGDKDIFNIRIFFIDLCGYNFVHVFREV